MLAIAKYLIPAEFPAGISVIKYCLGKSSHLSFMDKKIAAAAFTAFIGIHVLDYLDAKQDEKGGKEGMFLVSAALAAFPLTAAYSISYILISSEIPHLTKEPLFSRQWMLSMAKVLMIVSLLSAPMVQRRENFIEQMGKMLG
ncbi:hypothetical protein [Rhabdochlamydiaceae symbiont of Dictyostelium giganteum]|uniref:hypothetical protein n=1 Tax=Rhabdochlamydiaceae symbiont of Dictyostelium giganteum TaxID=3342349 RepID=UPI00384EB6C2